MMTNEQATMVARFTAKSLGGGEPHAGLVEGIEETQNTYDGDEWRVVIEDVLDDGTTPVKLVRSGEGGSGGSEVYVADFGSFRAMCEWHWFACPPPG